MMKLKVLKDGVEIKSFDLEELEKSSVVLGRGDDADIRLDDRMISRRHALIRVVPTGGVLVQKSSNMGKLQVNGEEVKEAQIKPGDVISIADYKLMIEGKEEERLTENAPPSDVPVLETEPSLAELASAQLTVTPAVSTSLPEQTQVTPLQNTATPELSEPASPEPVLNEEPFLDSGEKTAMVAVGSLTVRLLFKPGEAAQEQYDITKSEISIGRGSNCDVIISDAKSSRKHVVIKKTGGTYLLKDQGSSNGTYVNGIKVSEQELSSGDVIRIGSTEFSFTAENKEYFTQEQQGGFANAQETVAQTNLAQDLPSNPLDLQIVGVAGDAMTGSMPEPSVSMAQVNPLSGVSGAADATPAFGGASGALGLGVPGLEPAASGPKKRSSLIEKFKALPPRRRLVVGGIILSLVATLYFMAEEQNAHDEAAKKKAQQSKSLDPSMQAFEKLPLEKKQFIEQTYNLALDHYTKRNYEQALYEIKKIFEIIPNYKDAKEISEYAQKGLDMIKAQAEEQVKREEEEKRKQKVATLVSQAQEYFEKGMEAEAKEVFSRILELDPDNPTVVRLKAILEDRETKKRLEEEQQRQIAQMKQLMTDTINAGKDLLKEGKYYEAIEKFLEVPGVGTDAVLLSEAKELITQTKQELADKRQPHLEAARTALEAKEYDKAREEFHLALQIDPKCDECRQGMGRIKFEVHERAQKIFIEAIIAESVSDLSGARRKYLECYQVSVPEDDYYGRCWRKYRRFLTLEQSEGSAGLAASDAAVSVKPVRAPADSYRDMDPHTEEVLENL